MKGPTIRIAIIFAAIAVGILYLAQQPHAQETHKVAVKNMEPLKPTAEDLAPLVNRGGNIRTAIAEH